MALNMLLGQRKWLKQIIEIKHNGVKNFNWPEATGGSYLQVWSKIWIRDYCEEIQLAVRAGLELGASQLQVQRSNRSATRPPYKIRRVIHPKRLF